MFVHTVGCVYVAPQIANLHRISTRLSFLERRRWTQVNSGMLRSICWALKSRSLLHRHSTITQICVSTLPAAKLVLLASKHLVDMMLDMPKQGVAFYPFCRCQHQYVQTVLPVGSTSDQCCRHELQRCRYAHKLYLKQQ